MSRDIIKTKFEMEQEIESLKVKEAQTELDKSDLVQQITDLQLALVEVYETIIPK